MSLKVEIQKSKDVSRWVEYKDHETGEVLAEFDIRGISYKPYRVALERVNNQIASKGFEPSQAVVGDKLYHELLLEACACHLIKDWKYVTFVENGEEVEKSYTPENATKLLNLGNLGIVIWAFIKENAERIQAEEDANRDDVLGK